MGPGACKTSHLGKNSLKNRRFLESSIADMESVFGACKAVEQGLVRKQQRVRGPERTDRLSHSLSVPGADLGAGRPSAPPELPLERPPSQPMLTCFTQESALVPHVSYFWAFRLCSAVFFSPFPVQLSQHLILKPASHRPLPALLLAMPLLTASAFLPG